MRVLLISANKKNDLLAAPPIGMAYVAQAAHMAGHEVRTLDLCFSGRNSDKLLKKQINQWTPDVVGLSIRNLDNVNMLHPISYVPDALNAARTIKKNTSAPFVIGGPAVGLAPEQMLRKMNADFAVVSDGERTFVSLLEALQSRSGLESIPGLGYLDKWNNFHLTAPVHGDFSKTIPNVGRWIDMAPYQKLGASYNIQSRRGCNQSCIYCSYNQNLEGNKLRFRDPVEVVDEIEEALFKYRPHTFEFVDSVFNDPEPHSREILEEILRRPWKANFTAMGVTPRNLNGEFLNLMWRAGFRSFMITPETASEIMISNYRKGFSIDDVHNAAEAINRTDFDAWWFFMLGGPGETNETVAQSLKFATQSLVQNGRKGNHVAHFFLGVRIYPGTKLWDIAAQEGFMDLHVQTLEPLWYVAPKLDVDRCVDQMLKAASICPEIYLGFDERVLVFSKAASAFFNFFGFQQPYWRYFRAANSIGLKAKVRFMFKPDNIGGAIKDTLRLQRLNQGRPARELL